VIIPIFFIEDIYFSFLIELQCMHISSRVQGLRKY